MMRFSGSLILLIIFLLSHSLYTCLEVQLHWYQSSTIYAKILWKRLAPLRVELLIWFILLGRLNTKDHLWRFNCIAAEESLCVFCTNEQESINHLFFACPVAWGFWHNCMRWWSIQFCYPNSALDFFEAWVGAPFRGFDKQLWISLMYVVFWSIWKTRNRIIFEGFTPN